MKTGAMKVAQEWSFGQSGTTVSTSQVTPVIACAAFVESPLETLKITCIPKVKIN